MWFLLGLAFPIVEVWLLFRVGAEIGLANTFFYLLTCVVLGIGLIRAQAAYLSRTLQISVAQGQMPSQQLMHAMALFASGVCFIFPGYLSTIFALALLLPGTRHLLIALMKRKFQKMIQQGAIRFGSAASGFGGFQGGFTWTSHGPMTRPERDVSPKELEGESAVNTIIDVTPTKKD